MDQNEFLGLEEELKSRLDDYITACDEMGLEPHEQVMDRVQEAENDYVG